MNIGARISILLEEEGISRREFARRLHINYSTASGYILNRRLPDCEMLLRIADTLNSSTDYLMGRTSIKRYKDLNYSPMESVLISNFRTLSPERQEILIGLSCSLCEKPHQQTSIWRE